MGNNSNYFYISGLISLSLFILILSLFALMMFSVDKVNSFALKKDNYISISLVSPKVQTKAAKKNTQSLPSSSESEALSEDIDVNDLFSDVWTKKIVKKEKKPINSKRMNAIQKKIKKIESNRVESLSDKLNKIDNSKSNEQRSTSSTAQEVNEYLAKIQAIVYQYFYVPENSQGHSVKTVIELSALGKVIAFRVLTYSSNEALNEEVDKIKDRLQYVIFPKSPKNISTRTVVILISEE